jgi:hypothetical protein
MNRNAKVSVLLVCVATLVAAGAIFRGVHSLNPPREVSAGMAYFSTDDGATWFADSVTQPSPFDRDGKPAYRVHVWTVPGGKPFVNHLERSASAHAPAVPKSGVNDPRAPASYGVGIEVKRPGAPAWTRLNTRAGQEIIMPRAPDGRTDDLDTVEP